MYFTGEMVYPWMFEDFTYLRPYKQTSDLLAKKADWGPLYNEAVLKANNIPVAAAVYYEVRFFFYPIFRAWYHIPSCSQDMYVDMELSQATASKVGTGDPRFTKARDS